MSDYGSYSVDELYNVYHNIDRESYPDRFKVVCEELKKHKGAAEVMSVGLSVLAQTIFNPTLVTLSSRAFSRFLKLSKS